MKHRLYKAIDQIQLVDKLLSNHHMCLHFIRLSSADVFVPQETRESTILH